MKFLNVLQTEPLSLPQIKTHLAFSLVLGLLFTIVEFIFLICIQFFLVRIGIVNNLTDTTHWILTPLRDYLITSIIFISLIKCILLFARSFVDNRINSIFLYSAKKRLFDLYISNPFEISTPECVSVFSDRTYETGQLLHYLSRVINISATLFIFLLIGLFITPLEIIASTTLLLILMLPMIFLNKHLKYYSIRSIEISSLTNKHLIDTLKNSLMLKLYGLDKKVISELKVIALELKNIFDGYYLASSLKLALPSLVGIISMILISILSADILKSPPLKIVSFIYIFIRISQLASDLAGAYSHFKLFIPSLKIVNDQLLKYNQLNNHVDENSPQVFNHANILTLQVSELCFFYRVDKPIIKDLNFSINTGEILLIQGESGAGKTTLLKLIGNLIKPTGGSILLNNLNLSESGKWLKDNIAYIGPDSFLNKGSLRENLLLGNNNSLLGDEAIIDSLKKVGLENFNDLDVIINEQAQISAGQKQRLAIARAILRKPKIFILDEPTSNLDQSSEELIVSTIKTLSYSQITIIVSHKNCFNSIANKIINF